MVEEVEETVLVGVEDEKHVVVEHQVGEVF